jgi:hypothetical protein
VHKGQVTLLQYRSKNVQEQMYRFVNILFYDKIESMKSFKTTKYLPYLLLFFGTVVIILMPIPAQTQALDAEEAYAFSIAIIGGIITAFYGFESKH